MQSFSQLRIGILFEDDHLILKGLGGGDLAHFGKKYSDLENEKFVLFLKDNK